MPNHYPGTNDCVFGVIYSHLFYELALWESSSKAQIRTFPECSLIKRNYWNHRDDLRRKEPCNPQTRFFTFWKRVFSLVKVIFPHRESDTVLDGGSYSDSIQLKCLMWSNWIQTCSNCVNFRTVFSIKSRAVRI